MVRVVVDTNTTVSAFLWGGIPSEVFTLAIEYGAMLLSSEDLLRELEETLQKPKLQKQLRLHGKLPSELVAEFSRLVTFVEPAWVQPGIVRNTKDEMVLVAVLGGQATHLVSGDRHLLDLGNYGQTAVLTARQFINLLGSDTS